MSSGGVGAPCLNFVCLTIQSVTVPRSYNKAVRRQWFYSSPLKLQVLTQHLWQWIRAYYSSPYFGCQERLSFQKNLEQMLQHQVSFEQDYGYFRQTNKKTLDFLFFFHLEKAVKLINSHNIVFLQSYANFQEVNFDGKSRKRIQKACLQFLDRCYPFIF